MREETVSERVAEDVAALRKEVVAVHTQVTELRDALLGNYAQPGGLVVAVRRNAEDIARLRQDFADHVAGRQRTADLYEARLAAIEGWRASLTNRGIGIVIGVGLVAAAGGGAGGIIAAVISQLVLP